MKRRISIFLVIVLVLSFVLSNTSMAVFTVLSSQDLSVDGITVNCEKYNVDGSNYFKLRDIAYLLNGSKAQFAVGWDVSSQTISILTGEKYTPNGTELDLSGGDKSATAKPSRQTIRIDGKDVSGLSVYNIGGNNYFKLRDLGDALGFTVGYDADTRTATISSGGAESGTVASVQSSAYSLLASWITANVNSTAYDGTPAYEKISTWESGANATFHLYHYGTGDDERICAFYMYDFPDGSGDVTIISLYPSGNTSALSYMFYPSSTSDNSTYGFGLIDVTTFSADIPISFSSFEGTSPSQSDCEKMATSSVVNILSILDDIFASDPAHFDAYGITGFGFQPMNEIQQDASAVTSATKQAEAFSLLKNWIVKNTNYSVSGYLAYKFVFSNYSELCLVFDEDYNTIHIMYRFTFDNGNLASSGLVLHEEKREKLTMTYHWYQNRLATTHGARGSARINVNTFSEQTKVVFDDFEGTPSMREWCQSDAGMGLNGMLLAMNSFFSSNSNYFKTHDMGSFGFANYTRQS